MISVYLCASVLITDSGICYMISWMGDVLLTKWQSIYSDFAPEQQ